MKIKTTEVIKDYKGKDLIESASWDCTGCNWQHVNMPEEKKCPACGSDVKWNCEKLTIRGLLAVALGGPAKDEVLSNEKRSQIHQLNRKLFDKNEIDLTVDERTFIKERGDKIFNLPLYHGLLAEVLFPEDKDKLTESKQSD